MGFTWANAWRTCAAGKGTLTWWAPEPAPLTSVKKVKDLRHLIAFPVTDFF